MNSVNSWPPGPRNLDLSGCLDPLTWFIEELFSPRQPCGMRHSVQYSFPVCVELAMKHACLELDVTTTP